MIALLLVACSGGEALPEAPEADPVRASYVATAFEVSEDDAFDLDDDGAPDNALSSLGVILNNLIAERLAGNVHVVVVQLDGVNDWTDDEVIEVGIFPAVDEDNDGTDNTSGAEVFDGTGFVDTGGLALEHSPGAIRGGTYEAWVDASSFQVGSFVFDVATGVYVRGLADASAQTGLVGIGVTTDALAYALAQEGFDQGLIDLLAGLADLDLNDDGTPETVSMAFTFDATACGVTLP